MQFLFSPACREWQATFGVERGLDSCCAFPTAVGLTGYWWITLPVTSKNEDLHNLLASMGLAVEKMHHINNL